MFETVKNGAIVVAHPDDESLWFGGLIAATPSDWTIICCSIPRTDPIRAWKFFDACDALGARGKLLPFVEAEPNQRLPHLGCLDLSAFDTIATHGPAAEYGHLHHRQIHDFVTEHYRSKQLLLCGFGSEDLVCDRMVLSEKQLATKLSAIKSYDHVLGYAGRNIPKWAALIERYFDGDESRLGSEKYIKRTVLTR